MVITVTINLDADDTFAMTPDEGAAKVIVALEGTAAKDTCTLSLVQNVSGRAGKPLHDDMPHPIPHMVEPE